MKNTTNGAWRNDAPTEKQIELATDISDLLRIQLPDPMTKGACSDFIADNIMAYKAAVQERNEIIKEHAQEARR